MKADAFRWNDWNLDHSAKHGCTIAEIELVVRRQIKRATKKGDGKFRVEGRGQGDRFIEVVFVVDDDEDEAIYVIHAMPLSTRRRRRRR
jgi:hypothetical protein